MFDGSPWFSREASRNARPFRLENHLWQTSEERRSMGQRLVERPQFGSVEIGDI